MTFLVVVVVLQAIWLLLLTIVFVSVTRASAVTLIGSGDSTMMPSGLTGFSLDNDGPELGSAMPDLVRDALPGISTSSANLTLVMLSARCGSCYERTEELLDLGLSDDLVFLIGGRTDTDEGKQILDLLSNVASPHVVGDVASKAAEALSIHSVPFAVRFEGGYTSDKVYLRSGRDILALDSKAS